MRRFGPLHLSGPALLPPIALVPLLLPSLLMAQAARSSLEVLLPEAAAGTTVALVGPGFRREARADPAGRVAFLALLPGSYRLEAAPCGVQEATLAPGQRLLVRCRPLEHGASANAVSRGPGDRLEGWVRFSREERSRTPRASDPWSILRDVPGVVVDRVNIGGSETAQQSLLVSHGDAGAGATFSLDGVDITDAAALGATSIYPDMDALESVDVRASPLDVRVRAPGVNVGLGLRAPRPGMAGAVHLRGSGEALESDNLPTALEGRPFFRNRTHGLTELGAEAGGPLREGRLWLFGALYRNELAEDTFTEHRETLRTNGFTAKSRLTLGAGSLSLLGLVTEKVHEGRDTGLDASPEARWRQTGPTWLLGGEDQRPLGGWSLVSRLSVLSAGFHLEPYGGRSANVYEDFRGVTQGSYYVFDTERPRVAAGVEASTGRRFLGAAHELLFGASYWSSTLETRQAWPGGSVLGLERQSVFFRAFGLTGFAIPFRDLDVRSRALGLSLYARDEARFGRVTASFGLRLDRLAARSLASAVEANPVFPELLPAVSYDGKGQGIRWLDLLPRAGVAWDLGAATTLRFAYAGYAANLGAADATFDNPIGRDFASLTYYWKDVNGNHTVEPAELDLVRGRLAAAGIDPASPGSTESPNRIDPGLRAPRTRELSLALERDLGRRTHASLRGAFRRTDEVVWRPLRGLTLADYVARGAVQGTLFGQGYSVTYYAPASESSIVPGNGRILTNREGYAQDTLTAEGALSGWAGARLEWRAWGAFSDWRERFLDREQAVQDPTPTEGEALQDRGVLTVRPGGLGRGDLFVNARWMAGASLRAALPGGIAATAQLAARDGFPIPYFQVGNTGDPSAAAKNVLIAPRVDSYRLPGLLLVDLRVDRAFKLGRGQLTGLLDVFNVTNASTTLQVERDFESPGFERPREIVRPRIVRLGLEYRF